MPSDPGGTGSSPTGSENLIRPAGSVAVTRTGSTTLPSLVSWIRWLVRQRPEVVCGVSVADSARNSLTSSTPVACTCSPRCRIDEARTVNGARPAAVDACRGGDQRITASARASG
jgi:hypothetical protein